MTRLFTLALPLLTAATQPFPPANPPLAVAGQCESVPLPTISTPQGSLYRGRAPPGTLAATLDGTPLHLSADGRFLAGFGRDATPAARIAFTTDACTIDQPVIVTPRAWRIQSLPTLPRIPVPDAEFDARRPGELALITAARATITDGSAAFGPFIRPANGPVTGVYGSQRILAGTPAAPHAGLDLAAPAGSPVIAPAAGTVTLAQGPFTLEGNLVMIDHGQGLVSAFLHLSRIDVKAGDTIAQGQLIGTVGRTGRATGPHLHWGVSWRDVRIDPARLLPGAPPDPR